MEKGEDANWLISVVSHFMFVRRLAYAVWIVEAIMQSHKEVAAKYVMYDIACTLSGHLKVCACTC